MKLKQHTAITLLCIVFTNLFYKVHRTYIYAYDTTNNIFLEQNPTNVALIGFSLSIFMAFIIHSSYQKLKTGSENHE